MRSATEVATGNVRRGEWRVAVAKLFFVLFALLAVLMLSTACSKDGAASPSAGSDQLEEALASGKPTLAGFVGKVCACKNITPTLEELAAEYDGRCSILILDVAENKDLFNRYNVTLVPTQVYFDSSGAEVGRIIGSSTKQEMLERLKGMGVE